MNTPEEATETPNKRMKLTSLSAVLVALARAAMGVHYLSGGWGACGNRGGNPSVVAQPASDGVHPGTA